MISIIPYSRKGVLIQWDSAISNKTISEVNLFNQQILSSDFKYITETIPAFNSITVCYDGVDYSEIEATLKNLYNQLRTRNNEIKKRTWLLPMLPPEKPSRGVTNLNFASKKFYSSFLDIRYTIGMKGFLPGFIYLAGLPKEMHIPRKSVPDQSIPQGSIAIGGGQCGIYPIESPGGWHVIGNCPIPLIDLNDEHLTCFNVGDEIQFMLIDQAKHVLYRTTAWTLDMITSQFSTS